MHCRCHSSCNCNSPLCGQSFCYSLACNIKCSAMFRCCNSKWKPCGYSYAHIKGMKLGGNLSLVMEQGNDSIIFMIKCMNKNSITRYWAIHIHPFLAEAFNDRNENINFFLTTGSSITGMRIKCCNRYSWIFNGRHT